MNIIHRPFFIIKTDKIKTEVYIAKYLQLNKIKLFSMRNVMNDFIKMQCCLVEINFFNSHELRFNKSNIKIM